MSYCAPYIKNSKKNRCFDREALINIANSHKINIKHTDTDDELWHKIDNFINFKECNNGELCWLSSNKINDNIINKYYKPEKPLKKYQWLKTSEINNVLAQFELLYNDFMFLGTVPIDFKLVSLAYSNIDICNAIKTNKTKIGFVFNLDKHDQKGSHWVSMFLNLKKKYIGYFDSVGSCPPPKEVIELINKICNQSLKCAQIKLSVKCNKIRHQYGNSECGVYSLYFIYQCLLDKTFDQIENNPISDDEINMYRDIFFRPNSKSLKP